MKNFFKLSLVFVLALSLRLYGINWDQGSHLHPDERFLTMVTADIKLPSSFSSYFDGSTSPLNPYNYSNYQFFVYGTLPVFLTKIIAVSLHLDNYDQIVLVGRTLSAIFDSLNIILLFFLSKKLFHNHRYLFLPGLLYGFCVLPLQLSHFFAVDTFLNTFLLATFVFLTYSLFPLAAIAFGLALASKISALLFIPIILLFLILNRKRFIYNSLIFLVLAFVFFRIFQPYIFDGLFKISPHFIDNLNTLKSFSSKNSSFPPSVQWLNINPLLFSFKNLTLWGLGLPLSIGLLFLIPNFKIIFKNKIIVLIFIWVTFLFFFQGSQFNPTMRYFLIIYPFILVLLVYLFSKINHKIFFRFLIILHLVFGLSFLNIYSHNHTRVDASLWIYQHLAPGSIITNEYWDDPLPLNVSPYNSNVYQGIMLSPYDPDTAEKSQRLLSQISEADFVIMSSNRLWRSIPSAPKVYPLTTLYYQNLFAQKLGFQKILEVNSYPGLTLPFLNRCYYFGPTNFPGIKSSWYDTDNSCLYPGIYLRDDTAEEAFSVYDHPKVLIFSRID